MEHKEAWPENEERLLQPLQQNVPRFARYILDYNLACILERVGTLALLFTLSFTETLVIEAPQEVPRIINKKMKRAKRNRQLVDMTE